MFTFVYIVYFVPVVFFQIPVQNSEIITNPKVENALATMIGTPNPWQVKI